MKMKKLVLYMLAVAGLCAVFCTSAYAASDDCFNADISIEKKGNDLIVTIEDSTVLSEKKPDLKLAFSGDSASVLHGGKVEVASVGGGYVTFQVCEGGIYIIAEGTYTVELTTAPGCLTDGEYTYTNSTGTVTYTESVPAKGHDFRNIFRKTCANCNERNPYYIPSFIIFDDPEPEQTENPFTDVSKDDYFFDAVIWAVGNGITSGTSATTFEPNKVCTRAEMVTFLWRAAGSPEPTDRDNPFTDVTEKDYFYKAVLWAVENGITKGTSTTTFGPNETCTRAQAATFLYRCAGSPEVSGANPFADVTEKDYFYNAVLWAVDEEITKGTGTAAFSPDDLCIRAHAVTFLYRYQQN